jgi:hypothetical protein
MLYIYLSCPHHMLTYLLLSVCCLFNIVPCFCLNICSVEGLDGNTNKGCGRRRYWSNSRH